jgi:predicted DCC family thiol-disulfide oxidoreductase YuxK
MKTQRAIRSDVLVSPRDAPEADILIFDGHCRFCLAQVRRIQACDGGHRIAFLSLHAPEVAERWPELSHDELMAHMVLIDHGSGRKHSGAAAFRFLTRRLPRLWLLAPLMHFPGSLPIWQFFYHQVAKIRYRFGRTDECDEGTCHIHF